MAAYGPGGIDDVLHLGLDAVYVGLGHLVAYHHVAVVALGHGYVDDDVAVAVELAHGLAKDEEERAGVATHARGRGDVEELDVLGLIDAVVQSLHLVVDVSDDGLVLHLEVQHLVDLVQLATHGHLDGGAIVLTAYSNGLLHCLRIL